METVKAFLIAALILIGLYLAADHFFYVNSFSDKIYSRSKVKSHCDYDLSQTPYRIGALNNGKLVLMRGKWEVYTAADNRVASTDTCYLKMRAYFFWQNSVKE